MFHSLTLLLVIIVNRAQDYQTLIIEWYLFVLIQLRHQLTN
jgi:hypothetical protein